MKGVIAGVLLAGFSFAHTFDVSEISFIFRKLSLYGEGKGIRYGDLFADVELKGYFFGIGARF